MKTGRGILVTLLLLVLSVVLFETTELDLLIQDNLYDFETDGWMVNRRAPVPKAIFYTGIKRVIVLFGACAIVLYALSFRGDALRPHRRRLLHAILALVLVPSVAAGGKALTNIYCPSQIERYGGEMPYVRLLDTYPADFSPCKRGKCFPAGHASGGFALMVLYFGSRKGRRRVLGLAAGLTAGWAMGLYQMMKGAHFLSDTVVTMLLSWLIILLLDRALPPGPAAGGREPRKGLAPASRSRPGARAA